MLKFWDFTRANKKLVNGRDCLIVPTKITKEYERIWKEYSNHYKAGYHSKEFPHSTLYLKRYTVRKNETKAFPKAENEVLILLRSQRKGDKTTNFSKLERLANHHKIMIMFMFRQLSRAQILKGGGGQPQRHSNPSLKYIRIHTARRGFCCA